MQKKETSSSQEKSRKMFREGLQKFIPAKAMPYIVEWLVKEKVFLKITPKRSSKLGDYRPPHNGKGHRISINGDLNQYAFLQTLIHEIAHLKTYNKYKRNVKSHGEEWKREYKTLMKYFLNQGIFPDDIEIAIKNDMTNPGASSCTDPHLYKTMRKYDESRLQLPPHIKAVFIEDVPEGQRFMTEKGTVFIKGEKLRKRFKCRELATGKWYVFSPVAEVFVLKSPPPA